jgi:hypothetical protein
MFKVLSEGDVMLVILSINVGGIHTAHRIEDAITMIKASSAGARPRCSVVCRRFSIVLLPSLVLKCVYH